MSFHLFSVSVIRNAVFLCCLYVAASHTLHGQVFIKDSIHYDKGIPGTVDFEQDLRVHFTAHDNQGRALEDITRKKNDQGEWELLRRRAYTYNNNGLEQLLIQLWDADAEIWQDAIERNFEYTPDGEYSGRLFRRASAIGEPLENHRIWTYTYDGDGDLTEVLYQTWDGAEWINNTLQIWIYNTEKMIEHQLLQKWNGSGWENLRQRMWEYDGTTGAVSMVTSQKWDEGAGDWQNVARQQYPNAGSFQWTAVVEQVWDNVDQSWVNLQREQLNYDNGVFKNRELQYWNEGEWVPHTRGNYSFSGGVLNAVFGTWDTLNMAWQQAYLFQNEYDADGRIVLNQGWQRWNEDLMQWENDVTWETQRNIHFWSELMSSLEEPESLPQLCSFPNPYPLGAPVSCPELNPGSTYLLRLADLNGQIVFEKQFQGGNSLSFHPKVAPGLYVVLIQEGAKPVHVQKITLF